MEPIYTELKSIYGADEWNNEEPMNKHTTFRVGGPAEVFVRPCRKEQIIETLRWCKGHQIPLHIIGNGSNLLVGDKGISGVVMQIGSRFASIDEREDSFEAESGALLSTVAAKALARSLTGMEFAAGIPGSLGGAVRMNAGAYGGEMKDILTEVVTADAEGNLHTYKTEDMDFGYRKSRIIDSGEVVLTARIRLQAGDHDAIDAEMRRLAAARKEKQPLEYPSAGSTFKRPEGYFAGKLIQDAGLAGYRVGDAQVSEKHCGFVINRGQATAAQIRELMKDVTGKVEEQFGVVLEPEVLMMGDF